MMTILIVLNIQFIIKYNFFFFILGNQCPYYYFNDNYSYSNGNYYCSYNGDICYTNGLVAWIWIFFVFYTLVSILVVINYKRLKDGLEDYHVKKGDHYRHEGF